MFKGINLKLNEKDDLIINNYYHYGRAIYQNNSRAVEETFTKFLEKDGKIDGSKLQESWFPSFESDVFISHSHDDTHLAICLAGWLSNVHGIKSFIDSCLWGYSNNLLGEINQEYSYMVTNPNLYEYDKVNYAASHINMMLSNALTMMIDKTECFIFLNTPQSISSFEEMDRTKSPWIYNEIVLSKIIRRKVPLRFNYINERFSNFCGQENKLEILYNLDLTHLIQLDNETFFKKWGSKSYSSKDEALNKLYDQI